MRSTDIFTSKYLKSADVKTKPEIAVISYLVTEVVGEEKRQNPFCTLRTGVRPMVLNRTNFETLEDAFGDSDAWPGHKVKIFCAPTTYLGKRTEGIRVAPIVPKPALKDEMNDEVPV